MMRKKHNIILYGLVILFTIKPSYGENYTIGGNEKNPKEVIDDFLHAVGGIHKIRQIQNMVMVMEANIEGMKLEISATSDQENKRLMQQTSMEGNVMQKTVIKDGKGFISAMGQKQELEEEQMEAVSSQIYVFPELYYEELGYTLEMGDITEVEGEDSYSLLVTTSQGLKTTEFFSRATGLKLMTVSDQAGVISYSDYQEVDGIKIPMKLIISNQMLPMPMEAIVISVKFNQELDNSDFD